MTTETELQIIADYNSKSMFIKGICKKYNISSYVFNKILKNHGVEKYDPRFMYPQNQRKYPLNEDFFFSQTADMAYVLGILASDGTVRKNSNEVKLTLAAVDEDYLKHLQKLVGGTPVKKYTDGKGYENVTWTFTSKRVKDELATYHIVPNKTFTLKFPLKLERKYWIDFIRGYFDGDGCISTAGSSAIRWQLCSKTKDVLEHIIDFFYEEYQIPKVSIYRRQDRLYYFQYPSTSTRKIYDFLYTDGGLYLPRKKEKFQSLINIKRNKIPRDSLSLAKG